MKTINRRTFLSTTTKATGAAFVFSQLPSQLFAGAAANDIPIGVSIVGTVREVFEQRFCRYIKNDGGPGV